ncbi:MAG: tetratricopeptide repeat protein [Deltaproteobacteria bacterium]|nr:tetratricopeptide repeat protein [Deltaproteobacteria bacterium]
MDKPVHVLIVTAAREEDEAARKVDDGALREWKEIDRPEGYPFEVWVREYQTHDGGLLRVALTTAYDMGTDATTNAAAPLTLFYQPECLAMCGVCAGNPGRTKLGDVIIADRVYDYDKGEHLREETEGPLHFRSEMMTHQLKAQWKQAAQRFKMPADAPWLLERPRPLELQSLWLLREHVEGRDPAASPHQETMCRDWALAIDCLQKMKFLRYNKGNPVVTAAGKNHVKEILYKNRQTLPEQDSWKICVGPLGTGKNLRRDPTIWDQLESTQLRIRGLDMEAAAIGLTGFLQDVPMIVMKGVMDYAEPERNDIFRPFAARAAAEVLIGFLRQHLELQEDRPTGSRRKQVEAERGKSPKDILSDNIFQTLSSASNPAALLNARRQVVPFFDDLRATELKDLEQWCAADTATSVRLFVGQGGSGKTRLFIEWARRIRDQGWDAGFVREEMSEEDIEALLTPQKPCLAVIDYAESRPRLRKFLSRVAERSSTDVKPLRAALLAREVADWWNALLEPNDAISDLLSVHLPTRLELASMESPLRLEVWKHAAKAFAGKLGKAVPANEPDLSSDLFGRPLYLHMAALAEVEEKRMPANELLTGIVAHEKSFWLTHYPERTAEKDLDSEDFLLRASRMVAAVTLRGGLSTVEEAEDLNARVGVPEEPSFTKFLRRLYPGHSANPQTRYLAPLEPDLLGEALVEGVLADANTRQDYLAQVFDGTDQSALRTGLTVLSRLSVRRPEEAAEWLRRVLDADVKGRATPALDACLAVCSESAHAATGRVLAEALAREGTPELARDFEERLPEQTVLLREVGVWATTKLVEYLRADRRPQSRFLYLRRIFSFVRGDRRDEHTRAEEARLLNNLGNMLSDLGRREEALKAAKEAVEIYRDLAKARPDAFLPDLAMSLNNLGGRLSNLGRREEALEAAQEATEIYQGLAKARPDAFLPDLAMSLNNLGNRLSDLGRREEALKAAQEATEIRRELAKARPDAFLPNLAGSLNNLGGRLSDLGRREEALEAAQEAVEIRRELAKGRPDAFLPDLAMSLNNLGGRLSDLGRREEALEAAQEAVEIYRGLAKARPDAFLPYLARSLGTLGFCLRADSRLQDAAEAFREGIRILEPFFTSLPKAHRGLMAWLVEQYEDVLDEAGKEPDYELLGPIKATFEAMKEDDA